MVSTFGFVGQLTLNMYEWKCFTSPDVKSSQKIRITQLFATRLSQSQLVSAWFPPGLENLVKWEGIFQSGNFVKTGKVRENLGNFTQNTARIRKIYPGKLREICQSLIVKPLQIWYHTLNKKKNFKKYWKLGKIQGNLSV